MSIASRIDSIENNIRKAYDELGGIGIETDVNKNIANISAVISNYYDSLPKVSGTGTSINLLPTKVGKIKSTIIGNTTQASTPTPDSPVEVQSVTGEQVITIEGKNLFDKENTQWYRNNGSAFSNTTNTSTTRIRTNSFEIKGGETYTLSEIPNGITPLIVSQYEEYNGDRTSYVNFSNNTFTLSQNTKYINLMFSGENFTSETNTLMANANIQLEKGSSATEYEPYQGQDYEINLGKNLMPLYEYDSAANRSKSFNIWLPAGTYTCSFNLENFELGTNNNFSLYMGLYYATSSQDITLLSINSSTTLGKKSVNFTTTNDIFLTTRSSNIRIGQTQHDNGAICKISNIQIEKGSQATSYSEYFEPIELCKIGNYQDGIKKSKGQQLFDKSTITIGYINADGSITTNQSYATSDFIEIDSSLTYSKTATNSPRVKLYDKDKNLISTESISDISSFGNAGTYTIPYENAKYIRFTTRIDQESSSIDEVMLVVGDTIPTKYEPYLQKDTWYIEKNIGKVVLDGTENWEKSSNTSVDRFYLDNSSFNMITRSNGYSNYFSVVTSVVTDVGKLYTNVNQVVINFSSYGTTTKEQFKTWLSTHNAIVYYVLESPTYTEITNQELLNLLHEWEYAKSMDGQTNISVEGDLPMILDVSALKGE